MSDNLENLSHDELLKVARHMALHLAETAVWLARWGYLTTAGQSTLEFEPPVAAEVLAHAYELIDPQHRSRSYWAGRILMFFSENVPGMSGAIAEMVKEHDLKDDA